MKILIAEDDPVSLKILESLLQKWEYDVLTATDGKQAWDMYKSHPDIQFIISDWMMPNLDGLGFCELVRDFDRPGYTYFILLTAKSQVDDIVTGLDIGADDFISKPFNRLELHARIHSGQRIVSLENELANRLGELSTAYTQMRHDLDAAALVQKSMLPAVDGRFRGIKYAYHFTPCDQVGGDLFNIVPLDDSRLGVYIFDVSGHGVPAALQAVSIGKLLSPYDPHSSLLIGGNNSEGQQHIIAPKDVSAELNSRFQYTDPVGKFITFLYGVLDPKAKRFTYTRAGHPYPIHISHGEKKEGPSPADIPIGIKPDYEFSECTIELKSGDRIYLYTDGVNEATNSDGEQFGEENICTCLLETSNASLAESITELVSRIKEWKGDEPVSDDACILGIEIEHPTE